MTTVIAINGSPRKDGNTAILIRHVLAGLEREGVDTELVQRAGERIRGCTACTHCIEKRDQRCAFDDDIAHECIVTMTKADGIILGSPVYFSDVTAGRDEGSVAEARNAGINLAWLLKALDKMRDTCSPSS
ncbi:MAG: flavodoxin family protein [Halobacteriota archaeon]